MTSQKNDAMNLPAEEAFLAKVKELVVRRPPSQNGR